MKLESLKSEKFMQLSFNEMMQIKGGDKATEGGRANVNGTVFDFHHDLYRDTGTSCTEYYDKNNKIISHYES
ncbi:MAG: hypothetical protein EOP48_03825 [Sphingobacteriales bacterium]|nr:MAG: hypothetical protein EOP48_03825 [Sphingobacteriales bacterium]